MRTRALLALLAGPLVVACGPSASQMQPRAPLSRLRADASASNDGEVVGHWALAEMLEPGGDVTQAARARALLDHKRGLGAGMYANLAAAIADEAHGDPRSAADGYVSTLRAAKASDDPDAPLVAWFATHHLLALRSSVAELYARYKPVLDGAHRRPRQARVARRGGARRVVERRGVRQGAGHRAAPTTPSSRLASAAPAAVRIAGPFGHGSAADRRRAFGPESPGPWPESWPEDPLRGSVPHVLKVEQERCFATSTEHVGDGIFYAESFFTTGAERDMIVAAQGAVEVWVDDTPVLQRDLRTWGVWQKFGVALHVGAGRHRVVGRLMGDGSSVRLLNPDGTPAGVTSDGDERAAYSLVAAARTRRPERDRPHRARARRDTAEAGAFSPLEEMLASYIAHIESMDDVATVLIEPLVSTEGRGDDRAASRPRST